MNVAGYGELVALGIPAVILGWRALRDRARWKSYTTAWCVVALVVIWTSIAYQHFTR